MSEITVTLKTCNPMNQQLIKFIELCLVDGIISEKEKEVIFRKSKELGVPEDECEIILESMVFNHTKPSKEKDQEINYNHLGNTEEVSFELKKIPNVNKLEFNQTPILEEIIEDTFKLIQQYKEDISESEKLVSNLGRIIEEEKITLKNEVIVTLNDVKITDSFSIGNFQFVVDELILTPNIKDYLNLHGSIEYGSSKGDFNPEYPHPISVIFNHVKLGHTVNDNGTYLSGYIQGGSFKYFKSEPSMILDLEEKTPERIMVHNKTKDNKVLILVFNDDFMIFNLQFSFKMSEIVHKKNWLGSYDYNKTGLFHTETVVKQRLVDPFF